MFNAFERLVAFRYLRAKRQEGFISVIAWFSLLGIALGVAALIIVMAVMNGFRHELLSSLLGFNGHVTVTTYERSISDYDRLAARVMAVNGVKSASPMIEGQVMVSANGVANGAVVRGVRAEDFSRRELLRDALKAGSLEAFKAGDGIFIGQRMANSMGLRLGSEITLISPKGTTTAFGTVPRMKTYEIVGIFNVGMYEYDSSFVFMPLALAQKYFKLPEAVTALEVFIDDPDAARQMSYQIRGDLGSDIRAIDWQIIHSTFFTALQVERNVMFIILTLIILVAAFNIISSQIMLVNDKARGVAIMRTMGATRGTILRIFFVTGSSVGVVGTALGVALGMSFALNIESIRQAVEKLSGVNVFQAEIYFLSKLPARVETDEVVAVVVLALVLSLLASVYPAWRAARLDPVDVLRYE